MAFKTLRLIKGTGLTYQELDESQGGADFVSEGSHTKTVGEAVRATSPTAWTEAQANSGANIAEGIVLNVPDASSFWVLIDPAFVTLTSHGLSGEIWLDQSTAGALTDTKPTSGVRQRLGKTLDANTIFWNPSRSYEEI